MDYTQVHELAEYRWIAPVLRELRRAEGAKFVTLVRRLEANDGAMRRTLARLMQKKWVMRNPGFGHPSRPEYILTSVGLRVAPIADSLVSRLERKHHLSVLENRWALPILYALQSGPMQHAALKRALSGISPRSLSLALKFLQSEGLVIRKVTTDQPPQTRYLLSRSGRALVL